MWDKDWRRWGVGIFALALVVFSACPVRAQNKSPPPVDRSRAALSQRLAVAEMKPSMPLQPGDKVICTITQGKKKARSVEITVTGNSKGSKLCPPGGHITNFVFSLRNRRHLPVVDGIAAPVGGGRR